jgi:type VI secretion system protein ImpA
MTDDLAASIGLTDMLAPLAGESPVGTDLRTDFSATSPYYRLRDARAEARAAERAADGGQADAAASTGDWRTVRQIAVSVLTQTTRDLEIAAWLTESLVRGEGIAGLAVGAALMRDLVTGFWHQGLYPVEDEDGVATRVAPVTGLNGEGGDGTLIQPLRKQIFCNKPDGTPIAFWEFQASLTLQGEGDANKRAARLKAGAIPFDDMEGFARATGGGPFVALRRDLKQALTHWAELTAALDAAAGRDSPPTGRVRDLLEEMLAAVARYAPPEMEDASEPEPEATAESDSAAEAAPRRTAAAAKTPTREDMLRELVKIADFFRRTEPHSPLAYTLDDAVRRGRMTWPELLAEIVPDESARTHMLVQLGIKPVPQS